MTITQMQWVDMQERVAALEEKVEALTPKEEPETTEPSPWCCCQCDNHPMTIIEAHNDDTSTWECEKCGGTLRSSE